MVRDLVYLGNETAQPSKHLDEKFGTTMDFGCQKSETGLFTSQKADGIMGMAAYETTLIPHLYKNQKIQHRIFSLCFSEHGGSMVLGAPETFKHTSLVEYARMEVGSNRWYNIKLKDIRLNGKSIGAPESSFNSGKKIIVDSGTTDSYLPSSIRSKFKATYKSVTGRDYATAYTGTCNGPTLAELETLPSLEFVMEAADGGDTMIWTIPARQYMEKHKNGKYCSSVYLTEPSGGVIGANLMMNHDIIFDVDQKRMGFAQADCGTLGLL